MKVRWTDESLRLRITPTELRLLIAGKPLAATLQVPGGAWHVHVDPGGAPLSVHAPGLRLMVEKDFPCTHPHPVEAAEPATERFAPTAEFRRRTSHTSGQV